MSLDVYLTIEGARTTPKTSRIMIREGGSTKEISREEWDRRFPDREPIILSTEWEEIETDTEVFAANITHNLGIMAGKAGIYKHLWRPDEISITQAKELIEPLTDGLARLNTDPEWFKQFNPSNGWGDYDGLVRFVSDYLIACIKYPEAKVSVWR